jgi:hypothetical protein
MASACGTGDDAQLRPDRQLTAQLEPGLQLFPRPTVHADFAPATALTAPHKQRAAGLVQVAFGEFSRFVDAKTGLPEHHDQGAPRLAVRPVARRTHDRDDLLDLGRVGGVTVPLVARRVADVGSRQRRGRPAAPGAIEHELGHDRLLADRGLHPLSARREEARAR